MNARKWELSRGIEIICDGESFIMDELVSVQNGLEFLCHGFNVPKGDFRQYCMERGYTDPGKNIGYILFASYFMSPVEKMSQQQQRAHTQWEDYINRALHLLCITHNFRLQHDLNISDSEHIFFHSFLSARNIYKIWRTIFSSSDIKCKIRQKATVKEINM